jgi:hypothetical protein
MSSSGATLSEVESSTSRCRMIDVRCDKTTRACGKHTVSRCHGCLSVTPAPQGRVGVLV